jgi:hypothetical protein
LGDMTPSLRSLCLNPGSYCYELYNLFLQISFCSFIKQLS